MLLVCLVATRADRTRRRSPGVQHALGAAT